MYKNGQKYCPACGNAIKESELYCGLCIRDHSGIVATGLPESSESSYQETHSGIPEPLIEGARWINSHTEFLVPDDPLRRATRSLILSITAHPDYNIDNQEWIDLVSIANKALESGQPPPQAESIPDGENYWIIGAPSFSRTEVDNLLLTQRAMIFNDFQCGPKSEEDVRALLKNPRKPKY